MKRFLQYAATGAVATSAHYLVLVALVETGLAKPPMGSTSGAVVGAVIAYLLNRRLAFAGTTVPHSAAILRFAGVAAIGAILNGGIVAVLSSLSGVLCLRHTMTSDRRQYGLSDEAFVMVPAALARGLSDVVLGVCARAGFAPRVPQEAVQIQTVVSLVSSGLGVAMVPASLLNLRRNPRAAALKQFVALASKYP